MAFNLRNVLLGVIAVGSLALAGCGGGFSCSAKGPCPNDPVPSADDITSCNNELSSACGSQIKDLANCIESNPTCDANGMTTVPSDAAAAACSAQITAGQTCCTSNPSACEE